MLSSGYCKARWKLNHWKRIWSIWRASLKQWERWLLWAFPSFYFSDRRRWRCEAERTIANFRFDWSLAHGREYREYRKLGGYFLAHKVVAIRKEKSFRLLFFFLNRDFYILGGGGQPGRVRLLCRFSALRKLFYGTCVCWKEKWNKSFSKATFWAIIYKRPHTQQWR